MVDQDGTATIEFVSRLAERVPLTRWDAPEDRHPWLRNARCCGCGSASCRHPMPGR
ncbi:MAG: hypothetical protein KIT69_02025 [Propionibacteriaceae bacterium]|nr:hypothetical protein [Propionibacteriaceae bacterium]